MKINYIHQINYGTIQNSFYVLDEDNSVHRVDKFSLKSDVTYVGFGQWMIWLNIPNKINLYKPNRPVTLEILLKNSDMPYTMIKDKLLGLKVIHELVIKNETRQ